MFYGTCLSFFTSCGNAIRRLWTCHQKDVDRRRLPGEHSLATWFTRRERLLRSGNYAYFIVKGVQHIVKREISFADREQRELYEAAKIIQHAYREYKARINSQRQNEAERNAAVVIQSYYRRYKQVVLKFPCQFTTCHYVVMNEMKCSFLEYGMFFKLSVDGSLLSKHPLFEPVTEFMLYFSCVTTRWYMSAGLKRVVGI